MRPLQLQGQVVQGSHLREDQLAQAVELAVQVLAAETGSEVACDHPVGVEHWYDVNDETAAKSQGLGVCLK